MKPKSRESVYRIVPATDGTYAVEARSGRDTPLTISGFRTEEEARAWVKAHETEDSSKTAK